MKPRPKGNLKTAYQESTCLVRLTKEVRAFITERATWGDSIDRTLRRLLGMNSHDKKR